MSNNYRLKIRPFFGMLVFICFTMVACTKSENHKLQIAAASNLQYVLKELVTVFNEQQNVDCEIILGSSGKLTMQLENAAPFDVFLSANKKYSDYLVTKNKSAQKPQTFAYGKLVLASISIPNHEIMETLNSHTLTKIAIPNPKFAPYGEMGVEFLKNKKLYTKLENKFIYGESVMQTNQSVSYTHLTLPTTPYV